MNLINKVILPLCAIASICCFGCGEAEPLYYGLGLEAEITMLDVEEAIAPCQLTEKEGVKVDLQDSTNLWNPFSHPEHAYKARISYRLRGEEDTLISGNLGIAIKGKTTYSGVRKIEYLFGNGDQTITLPQWRARQKFEFGDLLGEISSSMKLGSPLAFCPGCHSISLNNRIDTREDNYRHSGQSQSTADRLVFEFSNPIATKDFGYRFHGAFPKTPGFGLAVVSKGDIGAFCDAIPEEQRVVMEKNSLPLKLVCYVGKGFKNTKERFNDLGFEMFKRLYFGESHHDALMGLSTTTVAPIFQNPKIITDQAIADPNEFYWVMEYGHPVME